MKNPVKALKLLAPIWKRVKPVKVKKLLTLYWKRLKHPIKAKNLLALGNYRWSVRQKPLGSDRKCVNHPVKAKKQLAHNLKRVKHHLRAENLFSLNLASTNG